MVGLTRQSAVVTGLEGIVGKVEQRVAETDPKLVALGQNHVDPEEVTAALDESDPATGGREAMYPQEQTRVACMLRVVAGPADAGPAGSGPTPVSRRDTNSLEARAEFC